MPLRSIPKPDKSLALIRIYNRVFRVAAQCRSTVRGSFRRWVFTWELMNRKCICRNVNSPCSMGCTNMTSFKQLTSIMECMAISKPLNTNVPRPNTETKITEYRVNMEFVVQFRRETVGFVMLLLRATNIRWYQIGSFRVVVVQRVQITHTRVMNICQKSE